MITAEIVTMEEEPAYRNLIIFVCYKQDGKELELAWNKDGTPIRRDGKLCWPLMARMENFLSKTGAEIEFWIQNNIEDQMKNLVRVNAAPIVNSSLIDEMSSVIGKSYSLDSADIPIDINGTGETRVVTIKDDGTITVKAIG